MKAKQRTLVILLVLAVIAGGALLALNTYNSNEAAASSAAADGSIPLSSFTSSDLSQITYTYNGETVTLDYDDGSWTLDDDPDYHLDSSSCNTMVTALSALNAKREITAQSDEDYGFDEPAVTVSVTAAGETNTFTFGAENSVTGDIYVRKNNEDTVYTVSSNKVSCFELGKADLFGSFNPAGLTSSDIESVSYTLQSGETVELNAVSEPVETSSDSSSESTEDADSTTYETVWRLASDTDADLDDSKINSILSAISGYATAQITNADASQYGFDNPLVTVTVKTADGSKKLEYSIGTDGYYLSVDGDSSVYQVSDSTVQALLYTAQELKAAE